MASKLILILSLAVFIRDTDAGFWRQLMSRNPALKKQVGTLAQTLLSSGHTKYYIQRLLGDSDIGQLERALEDDDLRNDEIFKLLATLSDIRDMRDDEEAKPENDMLSKYLHSSFAKLGDADSKTDHALSKLVEEAG